MKLLATLGVSAVAVLAACGHGKSTAPAPYATTTTTSAEIIRADSAAEQLAAAECQHELACKDVGPGKKYESHASCMTQLLPGEQNGLRREACPRGVGVPELKDCLHDIETRSCGRPLDTGVSRQSSVCRTGYLCVGS